MATSRKKRFRVKSEKSASVFFHHSSRKMKKLPDIEELSVLITNDHLFFVRQDKPKRAIQSNIISTTTGPSTSIKPQGRRQQASNHDPGNPQPSNSTPHNAEQSDLRRTLPPDFDSAASMPSTSNEARAQGLSLQCDAAASSSSAVDPNMELKKQ